MNEYLERTLVVYYRRRVRASLWFLAGCAAAVVIVAMWVAIARPPEWYFTWPVGLVGMPCALAVLVMGTGAALISRCPVLAALHTRPGGIREVRRGARRFGTGRLYSTFERVVPTLFIRFADGYECQLLSNGDDDEFERIQRLLEKEIERGRT